MMTRTSRKPTGNREHWERLGAGYAMNWKKPARQVLSEKEIAFVLRYAGTRPVQRALDIGIGQGRILQGLLAGTVAAELYGVDIAAEMVSVCRGRFAAEPRVKALVACDVSREELPFQGQFDFISAIRMLKYNRNWSDILAMLAARLRPGSIVVFTMPNRNSLNRFARPYTIPWYPVSRRDVETVCERVGLQILEVTSFTKLPAAAYELSDSAVIRRGVLLTEGVLERAVGGSRWGRELFVAASAKEG